MKKMWGLLKEDKGQGMVEYGLIIALVAITVIVAVTALGTNLNNVFNIINGELEDVSR